MINNFEIDWTTQLVLTTGSSDGHVTIPVPTPINLGVNPRGSSDVFWVLMVEGNDIYINGNAAATSSNACMPVGILTTPFRYPPGTTIHAINGPKGSGILSLVRCFPVA